MSKHDIEEFWPELPDYSDYPEDHDGIIVPVLPAKTNQAGGRAS